MKYCEANKNAHIKEYLMTHCSNYSLDLESSSLDLSQMPRSDWAHSGLQSAPQSFSSPNTFLIWPVDSHSRTPKVIK